MCSGTHREAAAATDDVRNGAPARDVVAALERDVQASGKSIGVLGLTFMPN
jgi:hypothetical protein